MLLRSKVIAAFGAVLVLALGAAGQCPLLRDVAEGRPFRCDEECMPVTNKPVYGTLMYREDSDVCQAGLHAGALNMSGGTLVPQLTTIPPRAIHGTCRNRLCSESFESSGTVYMLKQTESVIKERVGGDMLLVHNNYENDELNLLCLTQNTEETLSSSTIRNWKYEEMSSEKGVVKERNKVLTTSYKQSNKHAFHCMGHTSATDVFASVIYPYADPKTSQPTIRASRGDDVRINDYFSEVPSDRLSVKRFPSGASNVPLTLSDVLPEANGLYLVGDNKGGAYFNVIVRDCEEGKYGSECQDICPKCQNGGQCHSYTGECLCPAGFKGDVCQRACPKGKFGTECQFHCDAETLHFQPPEDGTCKGLTVCLPGPLGCSCPAGYKGPVCNEECETGEYGAGCSETCQLKCRSDDCDSVTGKCPPAIPENLSISASTPTSLTVAWDEDAKNEHYDSYRHTISYKLLARMSCNSTDQNEDWKYVVKEEQPIVLDDLEAHSSYNVCVVVSDTDAKTSPKMCLVAHTGVQEPTVNVTKLACVPDESDSSVVCTATLQGNCEHYNGPDAKLVFGLKSSLECNHSQTWIEERELLPSDIDQYHNGLVKHTFRNLTPGQKYQPSAGVEGVPVPGYALAEAVVTAELAPPPIRNYNVVTQSETQVQILWNDPCPSNGEITEYSIKVGDVFEEDLPVNETSCSDDADYSRCYVIPGLQPGATYDVAIWTGNSKYFSDANNFTVATTETKPGIPNLGERVRHPRSLDLVIDPPTHTGGQLVNCTVTGPDTPCVMGYTGDKPMKCQFGNLDSGKVYNLETYCCNVKLCGDKRQIKMATTVTPEFQGSISVMEVTNSTISITLPRFINEGEAKSAMAVVVEHLTEGQNGTEDLKDVALLWGQNGTKSLKDVALELLDGPTTKNLKPDCDATVRIAGLVLGTTNSFQVGDGVVHGGFYNCPLEQGMTYGFAILGIAQLQDDRAEIWQRLADPVKVVPVAPVEDTSFMLAIIIGIVIIVILLCLVICLIIRRRRNSKAEDISAVTFTNEAVEIADKET